MQQSSANPRDFIISILGHLDHVLPGQAPIHDFVHHNTLHGFQHLPFEEALVAFEALTGISGYLPEAEYRSFYCRGRIDDHDIDAALARIAELDSERVLFRVENRVILSRDVYRVALAFAIEPVTVAQLHWQVEELNALHTFQADVPEIMRKRAQGQSVSALWQALLSKLELTKAGLHPESLLDLSLEQAEKWLAQANRVEAENGQSMHQQMLQQARTEWQVLLAQVGDTLTLRGFVQALCGIDILEAVRPQLIRICASGMDEGLAPWQLPERKRLGIYAAWKAAVSYDLEPLLQELPDGRHMLVTLPEDPVDAIIEQLTALAIPESCWQGYLQRLTLELPGWSGLFNWRQQHRQYQSDNDAAPGLADYCAIRLTLDRLWLNRVCQEHWRMDANFNKLQHYFAKNLSEFRVRQRLYQGDLPEYLSQQAEAMVARIGVERQNRADWQRLAELIWTWQLSLAAQVSDSGHSIYDSGWRLFRLSQHLGLGARQIQTLPREDLLTLLTVLNRFSAPVRNAIWLYAYEYHYRETFLQALQANHQCGRWQTRNTRPEAQAIFCMDEREESFRRHLEELNPAIETLGAAGFFGIPMKYRGLDDNEWMPLCPVVVTPTHEVIEVAKQGSEAMQTAHAGGRRFYKRLTYLVQQSLRRNLIPAQIAIDVLAPGLLFGLLGKIGWPRWQQLLESRLKRVLVPEVPTELKFTSTDDVVATVDQPKLGFTDIEQAERVTQFLRTVGLTAGFGHIVCLMGHGSTSQNNPHEAAHDCGACGGRQGGPNARVFAAMANRPEVRRLLAANGLHIPQDCWFVGAQHDTCSDKMTWYDVDTIPLQLHTEFEHFQTSLRQARDQAAHERCRRFVSARHPDLPQAALRHVQMRSFDLSQVRPEFGHATNAAAVIGRRALTQGLFLDRRVFLISYDPSQDPEGLILENILLTAGPVGAGINLEYYFSTVNNERFGCGTKIPHNVTGLFGVMEGATSDLRTGLPKQMVEIHEAMRLQIVVEAKTAVLEQIYHRQQVLQELVGGGWVHLSAKDPDTGAIFIFERGIGFVRWQADAQNLPVSAQSLDCYQRRSQPIAPVLIRQPVLQEVS